VSSSNAIEPFQPISARIAAMGLRGILRLIGFVLVNLWLVYHLTGIVIAPWSVPPSSRLVQNSWSFVKPYVQILFLNHGYHYFAPEPGNSTLVAYVLDMPDGRQVRGGFPIAESGRGSCTIAISC
jgi:hypothetical protein